MTYICTCRKSTAKTICTLLFISATVFAVFSALKIGYRGIWEMLLAASGIGIIQISQKYLLAGYEYILDPEESLSVRNRMTVIKVQGKKRISLIQLNLKNLTEVIPYTKLSVIKENYGNISEKMSFCADMFPKNTYLMLFEVNGKLSVVRIQCEKEFADILNQIAGI